MPPRPTLRRRTFRNGPIRLAADSVDGRGTPWIYLHGLASSRHGEKGNAFVEFALRTDRALHRIDFRGHGESDGSLAQLTISDLCADVGAVLDEVGPSVLIGSSLGGLVAAWTAARRPERVEALVLLAPAFGIVPGLRAGCALDTSGSGNFVEVGPHVLEDATHFDEAELAACLTMPTLAIHGAQDQVVAATDVERLFDAVPHSDKQLWLVQGGDHGLGDHLPAILDRIAEFVAAAAGAAD